MIFQFLIGLPKLYDETNSSNNKGIQLKGFFKWLQTINFCCIIRPDENDSDIWSFISRWLMVHIRARFLLAVRFK